MWPLRRSPRAPDVTAGSAPSPAWATLPELSPSFAEPEPTFKVGATVTEDLVAWRSPRLSQSLGHRVSDDGPAGTVTGLLEPITVSVAQRRVMRTGSGSADAGLPLVPRAAPSDEAVDGAFSEVDSAAPIPVPVAAPARPLVADTSFTPPPRPVVAPPVQVQTRQLSIVTDPVDTSPPDPGDRDADDASTPADSIADESPSQPLAEAPAGTDTTAVQRVALDETVAGDPVETASPPPPDVVEPLPLAGRSPRSPTPTDADGPQPPADGSLRSPTPPGVVGPHPLAAGSPRQLASPGAVGPPATVQRARSTEEAREDPAPLPELPPEPEPTAGPAEGSVPDELAIWQRPRRERPLAFGSAGDESPNPPTLTSDDLPVVSIDAPPTIAAPSPDRAGTQLPAIQRTSDPAEPDTSPETRSPGTDEGLPTRGEGAAEPRDHPDNAPLPLAALAGDAAPVVSRRVDPVVQRAHHVTDRRPSLTTVRPVHRALAPPEVRPTTTRGLVAQRTLTTAADLSPGGTLWREVTDSVTSRRNDDAPPLAPPVRGRELPVAPPAPLQLLSPPPLPVQRRRATADEPVVPSEATEPVAAVEASSTSPGEIPPSPAPAPPTEVPPPGAPIVAELPPAPPAAASASTASETAVDTGNLDELAHKLYDRIRWRLRGELRLDMERAGLGAGVRR